MAILNDIQNMRKNKGRERTIEEEEEEIIKVEKRKGEEENEGDVK